jgi:SanA protein
MVRDAMKAHHVNIGLGILLASLAAAAFSFAMMLAIGYVGYTIGAAYADAYIPDHVGDLPTVDAAMVLGTAPYGVRSQRFRTLSYRLQAAYDLWSHGKARYLIVSGNREGETYDEPTAMRDGLVAMGIPKEFIYRDFGGVRTWESVVRLRDIYGLKSTIIVSERDHLGRALFVARHIGLEGFGYAAVGRTYEGWKGNVIGNLSISRAYFDLIFHGRPRAGRKVAIGLDPPE